MSVLSQKEAVFQATNKVLAERGIKFERGDNIADVVAMAKDIKPAVVSLVVAGFLAGTVSMDEESRAKYDTEQKLKTYTSGMVNNWFRKDKRLNGDVQYVTKNPGSRAGSGDELLRELKKLHASKTAAGASAEQLAKIQTAIDNRKAELAAAKAEKIIVNRDLIPADLQYLLDDAV